MKQQTIKTNMKQQTNPLWLQAPSSGLANKKKNHAVVFGQTASLTYSCWLAGMCFPAFSNRQSRAVRCQYRLHSNNVWDQASCTVFVKAEAASIITLTESQTALHTWPCPHLQQVMPSLDSTEPLSISGFRCCCGLKIRQAAVTQAWMGRAQYWMQNYHVNRESYWVYISW